MFISDGKGSKTEVRPGLISKEGIFLLLVDANETEHYRFSDESGLILSLQKRVYALKRSNQELRDELQKAVKHGLEHGADTNEG